MPTARNNLNPRQTPQFIPPTAGGTGVAGNPNGGFRLNGREYTYEELQRTRPAFFRRYQQSQGNSGTPYRNAGDLPEFRPAGRLQNGTSVPDRFFYRGQQYDARSFQQQFPGVYADYQRANGNSGGIPAGQPGSPYPATTPANTFEGLIDQARADIDRANQRNEQRYQRLFQINQRRLNETDQMFSGIRTQLEADGTANDAEFSRIEEEMRQRRGTIEQGYDEAASYIRGVGERAYEDVGRRGASRDATSEQDLVSRGMFSTLAREAAQQRNSETQSRENRDVMESVGQMRAGLQTQRTTALGQADADIAGVRTNRMSTSQANRLRLAELDNARRGQRDQILGDRAGFVERRIDQGPNIGDLANSVAAYQQARNSRSSTGSSIFTSLLGGLTGGLSGGLSSGIGSLFGGLFD